LQLADAIGVIGRAHGNPAPASAGGRFVAGVVLYDGSATIAFGDSLYAVPIRKLWEVA
jgi:hypothetical protein